MPAEERVPQAETAAPPDWRRLGEVVTEATGLHFPRERWPDLRRGVERAAGELGGGDVTAFVDRLLSGPAAQELRVLAHHLTVPETYFFREMRTFDVLAEQILPPLLHERRRSGRRLRIWSAGCCTGEEAYSLAILVRQLLPDIADWDVRIYGTDLNPRYLAKAVAGAYGAWSFRNAPAGMVQRHFVTGADGRHEVRPEIRAMVTFAPLNLVDLLDCTLAPELRDLDVVFCRNVLMYFAPARMRAAVSRLRSALKNGGWLAVSPGEASSGLFRDFATRNFPGAILYQKTAAPERAAPHPAAAACSPSPAPWIDEMPAAQAPRPPTVLSDAPRRAVPPTQDSPGAAAHRLADEGRLDEALHACELWIGTDRLNARGYRLKAAIQLERSDREGARRSLECAVYLDPESVLPHFNLANIALASGKTAEATRHFENARRLLARMAPGDFVPESGGLTASALAAVVSRLAPEMEKEGE